ncbi:MAG: hypothetical protein Q7Q71_16060 [Verrucomicrobiota bacterium JB023]|nr:hypothetical protein [Verrucomicrobiota bacterium JB023]
MNRLTLFSAFLLLLPMACAPVHERTAGGGAFDNSVMGRSLDANTTPPAASYDERSFDEIRDYKELRRMEELGE